MSALFVIFFFYSSRHTTLLSCQSPLQPCLGFFPKLFLWSLALLFWGLFCISSPVILCFSFQDSPTVLTLYFPHPPCRAVQFCYPIPHTSLPWFRAWACHTALSTLCPKERGRNIHTPCALNRKDTSDNLFNKQMGQDTTRPAPYGNA